MIPRFADFRERGSWVSKLRAARFEQFVKMFGGLEQTRILDAGGTAEFWIRHRDFLPSKLDVTILNLGFLSQPVIDGISYVCGDARAMDMFQDRQFDICFSNSVIEHVGDFSKQTRMANEVCRVARGYYVQTPNRYFPVEPHFQVPGWQFAPVALRVRLLRASNIGWMRRARDPHEALETVRSIQLLSAGELHRLFPQAEIAREKVMGLTKSLIAWRPPK